MIRGTTILAAACATLAACSPASPPATAPAAPQAAPPAPPSLVPREALFELPAAAALQLSPDGTRIAYLAPTPGATGQGPLWRVMTALVSAPPSARALTQEGRPFVALKWADSGATLIAVEGEESGAAVAIDFETGRTTPLTGPDERASSDLIGVSPAQPDSVVLAIRPKGQAAQRLVQVDVRTGVQTVLDRNLRGFSEFFLDGRNRPRLARLRSGAAGDSLWRLDGRRWTKIVDISPVEALATRPLSVSPAGDAVLMLDSVDRDRAALVSLLLETGEKKVLGESRQADVDAAWIDPPTGEAQAFGSDYLRPAWTSLTPGAQADFAALDAALAGEFQVVSRSRDDAIWVVYEEGPQSPGAYHLYDRRARTVTPIFATRPRLSGVALQPMTPVEIASRDGQVLVSYLTLPAGSDPDGDGRPEQPLPMALVVHDPLTDRDRYGFRQDHQLLANRGYAVLSVNYRGSVGLGRAFVALGDRAWGAGVQTDLEDATAWAIARGITAAGRIGVVGSGLAGAAALTALADTEKRFACAAAIDAPVNLMAYVSNPPPRIGSVRAEIVRRLGDPGSPADETRLRRASPLERVAELAGPVLLLGGAERQGDLERLAAALGGADKPVALAIYPGASVPREGPDGARAAGLVEGFFLGCLGGRAEPIEAMDRTAVQRGAALLSGDARRGLRATQTAGDRTLTPMP